MKIFLVRHGQTGGNLAHRHQAVDTPLTKEGEAQAHRAATRIKELNPTHLVCSSMVRAIETARIIGDACDLVPVTEHRFSELNRPKKLYGNYHKSIRSLFFYAQWYLGYENKDLLDGETYAQLRQRLKESQAVLEAYPADARVAVVSHSVFINLFTAHLCQDGVLTPWQALKAFRGVLTMPNAHIIEITFDPTAPPNTCRWMLVR